MSPHELADWINERLPSWLEQKDEDGGVFPGFNQEELEMIMQGLLKLPKDGK